MYSKTLVPHADILAGDNAIDHANQIASMKDPAITFLHVVEQVPNAPSMTFGRCRKHLVDDLKNVRDKIKT